MTSGSPAPGEPRQQALVDALLALTSSSDVPFDLELHAALVLQHAAFLVPGSALSMEMPDADGALETVAASSAAAAFFAAHAAHASGPSTAAYTSGDAVSVADLSAAASAWPQQRSPATDAGFHALYAAPMRQGLTIRGVLVFYRSDASPFTATDCTYAQALADTAAIALTTHQTLTHQKILVDQLQGAFHTRLIIEQAKGFLAGHLDTDSNTAFTILRNHARSHRVRLHHVAREVMRTRTWPPKEK
ncbi:GAF and ANTAR domain-containing protein [Streptomyces violens]|uniref:GAF and ANTAR domain-containing protein n=1 Tax=Streptomyces violens TaxID=66377 RepID=UPI00068F8C2B|nr:GAF and ANTAR domain-containing protein [Streptomyces violens]